MSHRQTLRSLLLFFVLGTFFFDWVLPGTFDLARQNPTLRDFFLREELRRRFYPDYYYERPQDVGEIPFLEQHVDELIDDFLERVVKKLGSLRAHFNELQQAREEILAGAFNHEDRHKAQARWKDSLKRVENQAKGLRKMISYVLIDLGRKSNFTPVIGAVANRSFYQSEIRFIEEQIIKAEQRINDYFFQPTHTVHVDDLKSENMLIHLHRVQKMAKTLRKQSQSGMAGIFRDGGNYKSGRKRGSPNLYVVDGSFVFPVQPSIRPLIFRSQFR